jgi:TolA-binding protein
MPRSSALPPSAAPLLDGFDAAIDAYGSELEDYRRTVLELSRNEYRRQRTALLDFYNAGIDSRKVEERARRELAILDFERFLADYPSNPTITPDVLYRLAELHFEKESDAYNQRNDAYLADVEKFERGLLADEPSEPSKDFSRTIAIFERLIQEFPSYRQLDGAYYLIGYCYGEAGDPRSRSSYQALVDRFPESRFAQEAWVRIGESFFKEDKFEPARAAYEKALTYPRSRITDKALFKLGWATYLLNRYDAALKTFQQLLALYREIGSDETAALKEEALQYTAITLAEEDWNLDGSRDADFLMTRVKRYLGDATDEDTLSVLDRLSGILIENQRFTFAVDLLKDVIARTPLDPDNPRRHKVIVDAYSRAGQFDRQYFDAALEEMGKLGALYGPGSDWFHAQDRLGNTEAMAFAEELTRRSLKDSADYYYNEADTISREAAGSRDPAVRQRAIERFRFAARIYKQFLDAYPNDPEAYDSRMFLAQALFFSEQFTEAGSEFDLVRESVLGNRYQRDAALFSIQSYETALEREVTAGRLERRAWPSRPADPAEQAAEQQPSEDSGAPRTVAAREPIPEQSLKLVAAYDRYISLGIKDDQRPNAAANFAFASARLYYEYKDYDEARKRFVSVLDGYCGLDVTGYAAILLVESYRDVGDYAQMEFWADEVTRRGECIAIKDPEVMAAFKQDITRYQMGAISQQAEALVNEGKFDEAAAEYIRLANEFAGQQNGALGLYNAGLIYEQNLKKFDLAMQQFERLYRDYPGSEWVDKSRPSSRAGSPIPKASSTPASRLPSCSTTRRSTPRRPPATSTSSRSIPGRRRLPQRCTRPGSCTRRPATAAR